PAIERELREAGLGEFLPAQTYPESFITAVHDPELVDFLRRACESMPVGKSLYPYVFPVRNARRKPREISVLAGYYSIDTFTPIHRNAYPAARRAVDCALAAADEVLAGRRIAYALIRPPGHHAERSLFGGFCYFNNAAIAAERLSHFGKVAILDVDYHHGNGQQEIFWTRADVLTASIHGSPEFAYPYFSGFEDELGEGEGLGRNRNFPLPEEVGGKEYVATLKKALDLIAEFEPAFLVVALGFDPARADPTGTWSLRARDFEENGRR